MGGVLALLDHGRARVVRQPALPQKEERKQPEPDNTSDMRQIAIVRPRAAELRLVRVPVERAL